MSDFSAPEGDTLLTDLHVEIGTGSAVSQGAEMGYEFCIALLGEHGGYGLMPD